MEPCTNFEDFEHAWPWVESGLETEIGGNSYTKEEIWNLIASGEAQVWITNRAANLTRTIREHDKLFMLSWAGGGNLKHLHEVILPAMEAWARLHNYHWIVGSGRAAWGRVLSKHGFEAVYVNYAKELQ